MEKILQESAVEARDKYHRSLRLWRKLGEVLQIQSMEKYLDPKNFEGGQVGERSGGPSSGGLGRSEVRPTGLWPSGGAGAEPHGTDCGFAI
jgi:hypothetical protein